jgi:membrane-bound ClpP family serine protease
MKRSREFDLTWFWVALMVVASLLWAKELMASTTGFLTGETVSGLIKICYYDTPSGTVTINVPSYQICPVTIRVP